MKENSILSIISYQFNYLNKHRKELLISWILIILFIVLSAIFTYRKVDNDPHIINDLWSSASGNMTTIIHGHVFLDTLFTNVLLSIVIICISLIPIPYLYILPTLTSFSLIGKLIGVLNYEHGTIKTIKMVILSIVPHGIFEITAIIITLIIAKKINEYVLNVVKTIFKKDYIIPKDNLSVIKKALGDFYKIVLPFLVVAAGIETFIVPLLFKMFI